MGGRRCLQPPSRVRFQTGAKRRQQAPIAIGVRGQKEVSAHLFEGIFHALEMPKGDGWNRRHRGVDAQLTENLQGMDGTWKRRIVYAVKGTQERLQPGGGALV